MIWIEVVRVQQQLSATNKFYQKNKTSISMRCKFGESICHTEDRDKSNLNIIHINIDKIAVFKCF